MADATRSFSDVRAHILGAHENVGIEDKVAFYDSWADNYEQDVAILDYRAPNLAAKCLSSAFQGDRGNAVVLDVACGTGLVSTELQTMGFRHFIGVDGSLAMLELAKNKGLYQELKQCMLGAETLPIPAETCNVVVIVGALSVGQVPVTIVKELWLATKPGGYVCMTTRSNRDNMEYRDHLECTLSGMEREGLWARVSVVEVEEWERGVSSQESEYIPGIIYLYKKSEG